MNAISKAIGDEIRAARSRVRMSQVTLAQRVNLNPTTISYYENGSRMIPVDTLYRIADALACEPTDFMPSVKAFEAIDHAE